MSSTGDVTCSFPITTVLLIPSTKGLTTNEKDVRAGVVDFVLVRFVVVSQPRGRSSVPDLRGKRHRE